MSTPPGGNNSGSGEIMLFGVRVVVDSMRKSVSLNNLSQYEVPQENSNEKDVAAAAGVASGYASADEAVHHSSSAITSNRERKRGVPWTEEEHKLFLMGLQKVGKGDWRGISRNFVKTRTPTQVASHAQKYFLRRNNQNRRRRRSSLFDITTDSVAANLRNGQQGNQDSVNISQSSLPPVSMAKTPIEISSMRLPLPSVRQDNSGFPANQVYPAAMTAMVLPATAYKNDQEGESKIVCPIPTPILPVRPTPMVDFDLNENDPPLSLKLSLSSSPSPSPSPSPSSSSSRHSSAFDKVMPNCQASIMGIA
ncbi:hypothetical protein Ancab_038978 [Ancistrocladus abbreviatus]